MRPIPSLARALLVVCFAALVVLTVAVIALSGPFASADPRPARLPAVEPVYVPPSPDYEEAFSAAAQHDAEVVAAQLAAAEAQRQADEAAARAQVKPVRATSASPAAVYRGNPTGEVGGFPCGGDLPPCYVLARESGGDPTIYNRSGSGASGLWQFMRGTWNGYGGYPNAADAPPEVQNEKARLVWAGGAGCGHWKACG